MFYMLSSLDEETDKKGVVLIAFKLADIQFASPFGQRVFLIQTRVGLDMPVSWCSMHKFLEPHDLGTGGHGGKGVSRINLLVEAVIGAFTPDIRARVRLHYGSYTEWIYESMTFGIPHQLIPLTTDFKIKTKNHWDYLEMRKIAEEFTPSGNELGMIKMTDLPANNDILLGKGKPIQEFRGNQRLAMIVDDYEEQYHVESSKTDKTALASAIVKKIQATNGRFLSKESGIWIEVHDNLARDKVSHMFRHQRLKSKKK